jgi:hypothetical protein
LPSNVIVRRQRRLKRAFLPDFVERNKIWRALANGPTIEPSDTIRYHRLKIRHALNSVSDSERHCARRCVTREHEIDDSGYGLASIILSGAVANFRDKRQLTYAEAWTCGLLYWFGKPPAQQKQR